MWAPVSAYRLLKACFFFQTVSIDIIFVMPFTFMGQIYFTYDHQYATYLKVRC